MSLSWCEVKRKTEVLKTFTLLANSSIQVASISSRLNSTFASSVILHHGVKSLGSIFCGELPFSYLLPNHELRRIFSLSPIFYSHDARPKKEGVNDQHFAPLLLLHWMGLQREIYKEEEEGIDGIEVREACALQNRQIFKTRKRLHRISNFNSSLKLFQKIINFLL